MLYSGTACALLQVMSILYNNVAVGMCKAVQFAVSLRHSASKKMVALAVLYEGTLSLYMRNAQNAPLD
jgi:hypothetical protein